MPELPATLATLLIDTDDPAGSAMSLDDQSFSKLREDLDGLSQITWPAIKTSIADSFTEMLDVKLADILTGAWARMDALREYVDEDRHPSDETALVPLMDHKVRSTHAPSVELLAGEKPLAKLVFNVELLLALNGVALKIRNGRIMDVVSGACQAEGRIDFGEHELLRKSTPEYVVPGSISFADGVAIAERPAS